MKPGLVMALVVLLKWVCLADPAIFEDLTGQSLSIREVEGNRLELRLLNKGDKVGEGLYLNEDQTHEFLEVLDKAWAGEQKNIKFEVAPGKVVKLKSTSDTVTITDDNSMKFSIQNYGVYKGLYDAIRANTPPKAGSGFGLTSPPASQVQVKFTSQGVTRFGLYSTVDLYYGTNRDTNPKHKGFSDQYTNSWESDRLECGTCTVTVPAAIHKLGQIERPRLYKLEFHADPDKHFTLASLQPATEEFLEHAVGSRIKDSKEKNLFIYVHGYNNSFEDAAFAAAGLCYDLQLDGAMAFFSWPSQGGVENYLVDGNANAASTKLFRQFLKRLVGKTGARKVTILAHSMGARLLRTSLIGRTDLDLFGIASPVLTNIVLAHPDEQTSVLADDLPEIQSHGDRTTLYASSRDYVIGLSNILNGGSRPGGKLLVVPGLETIDASNLDLGLTNLGHDTYSGDRRSLDDLILLVCKNLPASQRYLDKQSVNNMVYWLLRK